MSNHNNWLKFSTPKLFICCKNSILKLRAPIFDEDTIMFVYMFIIYKLNDNVKCNVFLAAKSKIVDMYK